MTDREGGNPKTSLEIEATEKMWGFHALRKIPKMLQLAPGIKALFQSSNRGNYY
jgi:hypothetical protein